MDTIIPDRETAKRNGWKYQVQWVEGGRTCFVRCGSGQKADDWADHLKGRGFHPLVTDLRDALQLH